jgi:hypothetical protein
MWQRRWISVLSILEVMALGGCAGSNTMTPEIPNPDHLQVELSRISGDVDRPRRHFRVRNPVKLSRQEAQSIYEIAQNALEVGYQRSGHPAAGAYLTWRRYNTAPYPSLTHGNHYLNNYANDTALAYRQFEDAGTMPVGSVIAKDSFSVTQSKAIVLGPLFIMEKMPSGFNYVSGDWKYTLIQPDGSVFGETRGANAERIEYCIACHLAASQKDHLYFIPEDYRITH